MKAVVLIGALAAVQLLRGVEGHGYVEQPKARVVLCHKRKNRGCWNDAPTALQNSGRFPNVSPYGDFDGVIASGMMATFRELDEQGADRWVKNRMRPGWNTFKWFLPANHLTKDFRYWITKNNWNPNGPLRVASFENKPFCVSVVNGKIPRRVSHRCNVPKRTGYHIVLAEWKIGDNDRTFYNVIDLDFSGNGGGGKGPAVFGPQPLTRYHDRNVGGLANRKISKWLGKGKLCVGPDAGNQWVISPKGCKRNVHLNKLRWTPPKNNNNNNNNKRYRELRFAHSSKCMTVKGSTGISQQKCRGSRTQRFMVERLPNGYYRVKAEHGGRCLDLAGGDRRQGAGFRQGNCGWSQDQMFSLVERGNNWVQLKTKVSGMCVSVRDRSKRDGKGVVQYKCKSWDRAQLMHRWYK